jgi:hypothetical protein
MPAISEVERGRKCTGEIEVSRRGLGEVDEEREITGRRGVIASLLK